MPQATCVQNVTFGATGATYTAGEKYNVPAALLKSYPEYFKRSANPKSKESKTQENK